MGLIALSLVFEPSQHLAVQPYGQLGLGGDRFNPRRTIAWANCSGVISGLSERSISSSSMASTRRQSVRGCLEVPFLLIACRFPNRDDSNPLFVFHVNDGYHPRLQQAKGDESLFSIVKAIIQDGNRVAIEDSFSSAEARSFIPLSSGRGDPGLSHPARGAGADPCPPNAANPSTNALFDDIGALPPAPFQGKPWMGASLTGGVASLNHRLQSGSASGAIGLSPDF